jgi:hypothetical protein
MKNINWIYFIPVFGFILFVYKSERYTYRTKDITATPPITQIGESMWWETFFILIHGTPVCVAGSWVIVNLIL